MEFIMPSDILVAVFMYSLYYTRMYIHLRKINIEFPKGGRVDYTCDTINVISAGGRGAAKLL